MIETLRRDREIFEHFCRKEEYGAAITDQFGRFPYYASRHRNVFDPVVSRYLRNHGHDMRCGDGDSFAVCLTHDVDVMGKGGILNYGAGFAKALLGGSISGAFNEYTSEAFEGRYLEVEQVIELERKYGASSSFYFLAVDRDSPDFSYDVSGLRRVFDLIADNGCEVGLHGSQAAYDSVEEMRKEKMMLEKASGRKVVGYRNHFLRFSVPLTWRLLQEAGFLYDTTLGYADCVGFRNGMCHPFRPYDAQANQTIDVIEIPLAVMDQTLFDNYMRLDMQGAWELVKRLIDVVEGCHGTIVLLWHHNNLYGDHLKFYEKILRYCLEKRALMTSGEDIARKAAPLLK